MAKASKMIIRNIKLELIDEPSGVIRMEIDAEKVQELAKNIAEVGLLQPINVRAVKERFEVVAGHRRFKAFQCLRRKSIPAIVGTFDDVGTALARASENLRRVDLSPIEEAAIYTDLHDNHGLGYDEIGKAMGPSAGVVRRRIDLLRMPAEVQKAVHSKKISISVAEELWSLGDEEGISYYLGFAIDHGATLAVVRQWVHDWKRAKRTEGADAEGGDPLASPMEVQPTYIACDFCREAVELGKDIVLRGCTGCVEKIKIALRG